MLKRIGLYSAALFATLALMQLPTASAQNRDGDGRYGYDTHQTNNYSQSNGKWNGNSYRAQTAYGQPNGYGYYGRQQNGYGQYDARSKANGYNDRNMRQSQVDSRDNGGRMTGDHERNSQTYRRSSDDDDRWERR